MSILSIRMHAFDVGMRYFDTPAAGTHSQELRGAQKALEGAGDAWLSSCCRCGSTSPQSPREGELGYGLCWASGIPPQFFCVGSDVSLAPTPVLLSSVPCREGRDPSRAGCRIRDSGWTQHKLGFALRNGQQGAAEGFELCFYLDPAVPQDPRQLLHWNFEQLHLAQLSSISWFG